MDFSEMLAAWISCQVHLQLVASEIHEPILISLHSDGEQALLVGALRHGLRAHASREQPQSHDDGTDHEAPMHGLRPHATDICVASHRAVGPSLCRPTRLPSPWQEDMTRKGHLSAVGQESNPPSPVGTLQGSKALMLGAISRRTRADQWERILG